MSEKTETLVEKILATGAGAGVFVFSSVGGVTTGFLGAKVMIERFPGIADDALYSSLCFATAGGVTSLGITLGAYGGIAVYDCIRRGYF